MDRVDHLITIVGEEAAEVSKETAKCLRFGAHEVYPAIGISNIERVRNEFNDLYAVMEMLSEEGVIQRDFISREQIDAKKEKVEKHLIYSAQCGRVDAPRGEKEEG